MAGARQAAFASVNVGSGPGLVRQDRYEPYLWVHHTAAMAHRGLQFLVFKDDSCPRGPVVAPLGVILSAVTGRCDVNRQMLVN